MEWMTIISECVSYIENHITEDIDIETIGSSIGISSFYLQKGFTMLCGYSIGEYIRNRRLALAGNDLLFSNDKIIDIAAKYRYDSPDSFTKAFTRFHGASPSSVRKENSLLKTFAPLKLRLTLEGGYLMDYRIVKKGAFSVIANSRMVSFDCAKETIPQFWKQHNISGKKETVGGIYGITIEAQVGRGNFEYLIADPYNPQKEVPEGFEVRTIPALDWAVFPCRGALPGALQEINSKIYEEWLPALRDYEFGASYCVEFYDDSFKYENGTLDDNYYCEIWIPVKKKQK